MDTPESEHEKERIERLKRAMYSRDMSARLGERPRHEMDDIRPIVGEDWKREEAGTPSSVVAPATIAVARKVLWGVLAVAIVFFVGAAGFFAYYFTLGGGASPASAANIDISVSGPPQISGGEPTQLQIVVTNRNQVPLQLADLVITYPTGTRSPTDLSTDLSNQRISLGTIEPGGRRQGTVSAIFAGEGGNSEVKVELEYRISGSSAIFVASSAYQALLSSSPISLIVEGNSETISGQPVELTATIASNANTTIKDVLVSVNAPFGFAVQSISSPEQALSQSSTIKLVEIGDLRPGEKRTLVLRGTLTGESGDERVFRFTAGTRKSKEEQSITTAISQQSYKMRVSEPFLSLDVSINKSTGNTVLAPGAPAAVTISYANNLQTPIQDAVIIAKLSGVQIEGESVISADGFYRSTDGVILWDKNTTKGILGNVPAGGKGVVSFNFQVPSTEDLKGIQNPQLTITVNAAGKRIGETGVPQNLQATASERMSISSDLRVTAQGLYYANPFGSVGPLPPKAGKETTYAIVFTITNTTNKIQNAKLTGTLPPYVRWVGIFSPGSENVSFNQTNGTFTWDIGSVEPGVGVNGMNPKQAAIAIGFTPSTSQIGQEPSLLQGIIFTGKDGSTGSAIHKDVQNVTTNIVGDPGFSATNATVVR